MSFPEPEPGLVIRYSFLWKSESDHGREEGAKDRPCAIVLAGPKAGAGRPVTVLPVTHSPPLAGQEAVEIPATVKRRLGLDSERSWIVLEEANRFTWPGPDLRPQPGMDLSSVAYGFLPPDFFSDVFKQFVALSRLGRATRVQRSE